MLMRLVKFYSYYTLYNKLHYFGMSMKTINHTLLLFIIIVIEGYVVLSSELLAIRQTVPYIGSGTDTMSIIIAAVLMPLAFGYQFGGNYKPHKIFGHYITVRKKLVLNILIASTILLIGMSHEYIRSFFLLMPEMGIENRLIQTSLYSALFLVIPVYLLGQTVPLVSNFFSKQKLSQITGKMLFFSTLGSFMGAIFSTIFLMATFGVHQTVVVNFVLLSILVIMLSKNKLSAPVIYSMVIAICAMTFNSDLIMEKYNIKKNNQYNMITATTLDNGDRMLYINRNHSSKYNDYREKHSYAEFIERIAIHPILSASPAKDILVIGAGGFTFGHEDKNNNYIYVDIDKDLLEISEEHILHEPIGDNKTFIAKPARAYLNSTDKKFDLILLDAYLGGLSIPEHLVTKEFFMHVKDHLKDGSLLIANVIMSPNFNNAFTRNIDNTLRSAYPHISRHVIDEKYNLWSSSKTRMANIAYIYRHQYNYDIVC